MRPTSTYDRSAPILSFSSSQSSSTSTTPPDHAHIGFLSSLTQSNTLSLMEEVSAPHSSEGYDASTAQQQDCTDPRADSNTSREEVFPDPEFDDQELKTITRQMIATALESSSSIAGATASSALERSKDGDSGQQSSDSSPLLISRSVDKDDKFEVLVAACSDDDWQPI